MHRDLLNPLAFSVMMPLNSISCGALSKDPVLHPLQRRNLYCSAGDGVREAVAWSEDKGESVVGGEGQAAY